ncbi:hypothetical protein SISNIDRAFT_480992 [Sistotremastrum niveocremeum HHB9708]|uniref:Kinetochore protein Sos7 coiled-coil domain-containing protein n=1 Tax=Sistotremastrum niveocremeum HHB9708 TaxID=1314777 RepID=A0A164ZY73_9AGAM|nr:hypothetical protein SISNIDRAFT_480992 [Sistotremastrum niveocremeum HHB9708]
MATVVERAESLATQIEGTTLSLHQAQTDYSNYDFSTLPESTLSINRSDPTLATQDVVASLTYLKKLKFHYTEQYAKGRYTRTIVSDTDPGIDQKTHDDLQASNRELKSKLKETKDRLAQSYQQIRQKAPRVEEAFSALQTSSAQARKLAQEILDAQLALSRLRASYPEPRLSVAAASTKADEQVERMQEMENEVQSMQTKIGEMKEKNKTAMKQLEQLKMERAQAEQELDSLKVEGDEDHRILGLYDWFSASLTMQKSLLSIDSIEHTASNELRITYLLPEPVTLALVFQPNTRNLAAAQLVDPPPQFDTDITDLLGVFQMNGDASGFLTALLARLRHMRTQNEA